MGVNPIIDIARESWDSDDAHACATEWLFQMARLWTEHQDSDTGTFPYDWRGPSGPCSLTESVATGEDFAYWDAVLALWHDQKLGVPFDPRDPYTQEWADRWGYGEAPGGYDTNVAMRHIMLATRVFNRIYELGREYT